MSRSLLAHGGRVVVLAGTGLSRASGVDEPLDEDFAATWRVDREAVRAVYDERRIGLANGLPNPGHEALVWLQHRLGVDRVALVAQSVDGLLDKAGAADLIEMNGSLFRLCCEVDPTHPHLGVFGPQSRSGRCTVCGAWMRPAVAWTGEPPAHLDRIGRRLQRCDLFLVVGSVGSRYPASSFAHVARSHGAVCVEIDTRPTRDAYEVVFPEPAEEVLPRLVEEWIASAG